jgi:hypothetical protein
MSAARPSDYDVFPLATTATTAPIRVPATAEAPVLPRDLADLAEVIVVLGFAEFLPLLFNEEIFDVATLMLCDFRDFVSIGIPKGLAEDLLNELKLLQRYQVLWNELGAVL